MKINYYGHASFSIEWASHKILFDPFIKKNPLASHIDINKIDCQYVLISHGHEDHMADAFEITKRNNATLVSNFEITSWFEAKGLEKTHPMNHGGKWTFDFGVVEMVNAIHSSSMPDGSYGGNPAGFILSTPKKTIYYAGDTALHMDMKIIPEFYALDWAVLPIGDNFTMGISQAMVAAKWLKCKNIIGMHYDTFGYIKIDHQKAIEAFKKEDLNLHLIPIGESIDL